MKLKALVLILLFFGTLSSAQSQKVDYKKHRKQGLEYFENSNYKAAIQEFNIALSSREDSDILEKRAISYKNVGDWVSFAKDYEKLFFRHFLTYEQKLLLATARNINKDHDKAIQIITELILEFKQRESLRDTLVKFQFEGGRFLEVIKTYENYYDSYLKYPKNKEFNKLVAISRDSIATMHFNETGERSKFEHARSSYYKFFQTLKPNSGNFGTTYFKEKIELDDLTLLLRLIELTPIYDLETFEQVSRYYEYAISSDPSSCKIILGRILHKHSKDENTILKLTELQKNENWCLTNYEYYLQLGKVYIDNKLYPEANKALSNAISIHQTCLDCYIHLAETYVHLGDSKSAYNAFDFAQNIDPLNDYIKIKKTELDLLIYERGRELVKPKIQFYQNNKLRLIAEVSTADSLCFARITITDESKIKSFLVNGESINVTNDLNPEFKDPIKINRNTKKLVIVATDIYNNTDSITLPLSWVRPKTIIIRLDTPPNFTSKELNEIYPDYFSNGKINIQGKIENHQTDSLLINGEFVPILDGSFNTNLSIDQYDETIEFSLFANGQSSTIEYKINWKDSEEVKGSIMKRTWCVFIQNSNYTHWANLDGPEQDYRKVEQELRNYKIQKVIQVKDLSRTEINNYFKKELRNLLNRGQVYSLVIWYAGHGILDYEEGNENTYWIPIDAELNTPGDYFNLIELKSIRVIYENLAHFLIVSDACETGAELTDMMRGDQKKFDCSSINYSSSQFLSASNKEATSDKSQFASLFAKTLEHERINKKRCIAIDQIHTNIKASLPDTKLGTISSTLYKGTFFFIPR